MAPTGSSNFNFLSTKRAASTTSTPEIKPMMQALIELTNAQGAVMATNPASIPLHIILGSGFLNRRIHIQRVAATAPVAEASMGLVAMTPILRSVPDSVGRG